MIPRTLTIHLDPASRAYLQHESKEWDMTPSEVVERLVAGAAADEIVCQVTLRQQRQRQRRRRSRQTAQPAGSPTLTLVVRKDAHDGPCEQ